MSQTDAVESRSVLCLALLAAAASAQAADVPAFLDSPTEIIVALTQPRERAELQGRFKVLLDGKPIAISTTVPIGDPTQARLLPQTPGRVVLAGTFQPQLGGREWDPDGEVTQMREVGPDRFTLDVKLNAGRYEYKIARGGSWAENYGAGFAPGGANLSIQVPQAQIVRFQVDFRRKRIVNSVENASEVTAPKIIPVNPKAKGPAKYPAAKITLVRPLPLDAVHGQLIVKEGNEQRWVFARNILASPEFYEPGFLGSKWSKSETVFRVWSPVSSRAYLLLEDPSQRLPMKRLANGTWSVTVPGDLHGRRYRYEFTSYSEKRTATDINCFAASPDSKWSMVVDLSRTNPAAWPHKRGWTLKSATDATIYEISVRDFTVSPSSGVDAEKRGKYLGLVQPGKGLPLDYLKGLGFNYVHLLPAQNFLSSPGKYTWGYATNLFNVPEETYSVTPNDPIGVIREFKQMVAGLHQAGIGVVMDVVYNHTWPPQGTESNFWQTVPYFYFRTNERGEVLNESGVGNALNDDQPMVRKFVQDSLIYWTRENDVDGFRFDLLGMFRPASVRQWAKALRAVRPDILLYGEPWTGGGPTRFGMGAQRGRTVAVFNDHFRNLMRGETDGSRPGFALGASADEGELYKAITGWIDTKAGQHDGLTDQPSESINYVSAHDNMTLLDRIAKSIPAESPELRQRALKFSAACVFLSQGVPFWEGGAEMGRTKGRIRDSYNSGDAVNGFDWARGEKFQAMRDYLKSLVALRKTYPHFRLQAADIRTKIHRVEVDSENAYAFRIDGNPSVLVVLHAFTKMESVKLPGGLWKVVSDGRTDRQVKGEVIGQMLMEPLTAYVFVQ